MTNGFWHFWIFLWKHCTVLWENISEVLGKPAVKTTGPNVRSFEPWYSTILWFSQELSPDWNQPSPKLNLVKSYLLKLLQSLFKYFRCLHLEVTPNRRSRILEKLKKNHKVMAQDWKNSLKLAYISVHDSNHKFKMLMVTGFYLYWTFSHLSDTPSVIDTTVTTAGTFTAFGNNLSFTASCPQVCRHRARYGMEPVFPPWS